MSDVLFAEIYIGLQWLPSCFDVSNCLPAVAGYLCFYFGTEHLAQPTENYVVTAHTVYAYIITETCVCNYISLSVPLPYLHYCVAYHACNSGTERKLFWPLLYQRWLAQLPTRLSQSKVKSLYHRWQYDHDNTYIWSRESMIYGRGTAKHLL